MMNELPKARMDGLIEQRVGDEILLYDLNTYKVFNLNETASIVYRDCDGNTSFEELKYKHKFTDDFIFLALDELKKNNLLADDSYSSAFAGMNRREVVKKIRTYLDGYAAGNLLSGHTTSR